ncbi:unnamed protein product [Withania somnifera]
MRQSKPSSPKHDRNIFNRRVGGNISSYIVRHSKSGSWGTSTQSGFDVTSIFNGDDMFRHTLVLSMVAVPTRDALQMHSYWCTQMDNRRFILGYVTLPFQIETFNNTFS